MDLWREKANEQEERDGKTEFTTKTERVKGIGLDDRRRYT